MWSFIRYQLVATQKETLENRRDTICEAVESVNAWKVGEFLDVMIKKHNDTMGALENLEVAIKDWTGSDSSSLLSYADAVKENHKVKFLISFHRFKTN